MAADKFLDRVYDIGDDGDIAGFYDDWARSYAAEVAASGYVTPGRCVDALLSLDPAKQGPVIDLGCGTGLAGLALRAAGFEPVDGVDFSEGMLKQAAAQGCYRHLGQADLSHPFAEPPELYAHALAVGVITPGHARERAIRHALEIVRPGGMFIFSLNDHALEAKIFEEEVFAIIREGHAQLMFEQYGDHLPARDFRATVYALKRL